MLASSMHSVYLNGVASWAKATYAGARKQPKFRRVSSKPKDGEFRTVVVSDSVGHS